MRGVRKRRPVTASSIGRQRHPRSSPQTTTTMEDGEIQEDVSGTTYHPALEWQGESSWDDASWSEPPLAGPSNAVYAPSVLGNTSQDYLVRDGHHMHVS